MTTIRTSLVPYALSLATIIYCLASTSTNAHTRGFTVHLIHRDSIISPFHNPHETAAQRMRNAFTRSRNRAHRLSNMILGTATPNSVNAESPLTAGDGEYLMNISIGTPPFPIVAIADTGSDILWTQCKPCANCYKQDAPVFEPKSSGSYRAVSCSSDDCSSLKSEVSFCGSNDTNCGYQVAYGDNSVTRGELALETLTMQGSTAGSQVAFRNILFGCGHDNSGMFSPEASGIVGLGGGFGSLTTQIGPSVGGKFSYCMVPYKAAERSTSMLRFGGNAVVEGEGVVSTPLIFDLDNPTFYFLQLDAISVGDSNKIPFEDYSSEGTSGNILIDSGTTMTLIPSDIFSQVSDAIESRVINGTKASDAMGVFSLCYVLDSNIGVPNVTMHFRGADLVLTRDNVFVQVGSKVMCLAFFGGGSLSIYGNVAQQNFLIGYDLEKHTLSFKHADCTRGN